MARKNSGTPGNRRAFNADARKHTSFSGVGGDGDTGGKPSLGIGSGGGKVHHASAKSKANIAPPDPRTFASFSGVGGKSKTSN